MGLFIDNQQIAFIILLVFKKFFAPWRGAIVAAREAVS